MSLTNVYTSTGAKFFAHHEAMAKLRDGKGQPIVTHVMLTDVCNHKCAFCSVQHRAGDSLVLTDVIEYLRTLKRFGLKAVILSGGGNPILYKCKETGADFNTVVDIIHAMGLEIGLITNGIRLRKYSTGSEDRSMRSAEDWQKSMRQSWITVRPSTLDKLTWVRISMAGLDHEENEVYVPDIDRSKTTLGFSYVAHDIYEEPADTKHGKVSRPEDFITKQRGRLDRWTFEERVGTLTEQIRHYVATYNPRYVRLLPNCLEPPLIPERCRQLQAMADDINPNIVFVQHKPPAAPPACYLGYVHPVLNCDGYIYPCDSCVLNETAGHSFANPWRVCHMKDVAGLYERPVRSLIVDPAKTCPGCVFHDSNLLLKGVVDGTADTTPPADTPEHVNFV
jgi:Radical SAM superfamily